jgi:hypothetical protein
MPNDAVPTWVSTTPQTHEYILAMVDVENGGPFPQEIEITREEYIDLKACLARMRGLLPAGLAEARNAQ